MCAIIPISSQYNLNLDMSKCDTPILLGEIEDEFTYYTLQLSHNLVCSNCQPKLDSLTSRRGCTQRENPSRRKCQQY